MLCPDCLSPVRGVLRRCLDHKGRTLEIARCESTTCGKHIGYLSTGTRNFDIMAFTKEQQAIEHIIVLQQLHR